MSDTFDHEFDAFMQLLEDDMQDEYYTPGSKKIKCKRCGMNNLMWLQINDNYVLHHRDATVHRCVDHTGLEEWK